MNVHTVFIYSVPGWAEPGEACRGTDWQACTLQGGWWQLGCVSTSLWLCMEAAQGDQAGSGESGWQHLT